MLHSNPNPKDTRIERTYQRCRCLLSAELELLRVGWSCCGRCEADVAVAGGVKLMQLAMGLSIKAAGRSLLIKLAATSDDNGSSQKPQHPFDV